MSAVISTTAPDVPSNTVEPTRVPVFYRIGLGFVAMAMVLLPVIYIALIVAVGWAVWWHLQNDLGIFDHVRGRGTIFALLLYAGPAVAGLIFVLFLIKPLFSRSSEQQKVYKVDKAEEPVLFAFVERICRLVGAPNPREIRLDMQVNASAGFRRGWLSFFGNDLVLVIGLPLAAGMTSRQLGGVLAHEFGHFAQGAGMRFSYLIRSINGWFARVVYERDHWDEKLEGWSRMDSWWFKVVFMLAKGGVWVGRKVLWCLMNVGHAISCFMSRQMEFDADSYEAKVAGSTEFARTAERLRSLGMAHAVASHDAYQTYQSRELPDDLAELVVWREKNMPEAAREELARAATEAKTRWNDTHPADSARIQAALAVNAAGVLTGEESATELFTDFPRLSQALTRHHFEQVLGVAPEKVRFCSVARIKEDRASADASEKNLDLFYQKNFHFMRLQPLQLGLSNEFNEAITALEPQAATYTHQLTALNQHHETLTKQVVGRDLLSAGFTLPQPNEFALQSGTKPDAVASVAETQREMMRLGESMRVYEAGTSRRLATALAWWREHHPDEASRRRLDRLITAQQALATSLPSFVQVNHAARSLGLLFQNAQNHHDGAQLEQECRAVAGRIEAGAGQCMAALGEAEHPYLADHPPVAKALHLPDQKENEWTRAFQLAAVCDEALIPLLVRIMGDLSGLALAAEKEIAQHASAHPNEAMHDASAAVQSAAAVAA